MSDKKEKPLPKPSKKSFGRTGPPAEPEGENPLMADEMAEAMARGQLDEYLRKSLPEGEYGRKLADMMMGMTGMKPPNDVVRAAESADVNRLMGLLKREHKKCSPHPGDQDKKEDKDDPSSERPGATIEKEIIDAFLYIASENNLSVDWLLFRAIKRYVQEYDKTGNL